MPRASPLMMPSALPLCSNNESAPTARAKKAEKEAEPQLCLGCDAAMAAQWHWTRVRMNRLPGNAVVLALALLLSLPLLLLLLLLLL